MLLEVDVVIGEDELQPGVDGCEEEEDAEENEWLDLADGTPVSTWATQGRGPFPMTIDLADEGKDYAELREAADEELGES